MRVVLDTNLLVRAQVAPAGPAYRVLSLLVSGEHRLVLSPFLLAEIEKVLFYPRIRRLTRAPAKAVLEYIDLLRRSAELVVSGRAPQGIIADPNDAPVLATAANGKADVLCTRDVHFYRPEVINFATINGFRIMGDIELLQML